MFKQKGAKYFLLLLVVLLAASFGMSQKTSAAAGINQQLAFEGKLVLANGTNITNGTYNLEFKIYTGGTSSGVGSTLEWTEDYLVGGSGGVPITNGTFEVNLGSVNAFGGSVNWNSDTLWLSMQVGNSSSCTITTNFQSNCGGDGEMSPYIRLTAVPYAFNALELGGVAASGYGTLAGTQTWTSANTFSNSITASGGLGITGVETQSYGSGVSGSGDALTISNSNASSTAATVNGLSIGLAGATNGTLNANTINGINFANVTPITNNSFAGLNFGTGFNSLLNYNGNSVINGTGIVQTAYGGTGLNSSSAANGSLLVGNGSGLTLATLSNNGGLTITNGSGSLGIAVAYGSATNTAVQGSVTLTCPSGSGNLGGGGTSITLGTGGSCGAITLSSTPTFTGLVTSAGVTAGSGLIQGTGGLTILGTTNINVSGNNNTHVGDGSSTGNIYIGNSSGTFQLASAGGLNVDTSGNLTGIGSISLSSSINGLTIVSGALSGISTISASGAITGATSGNTINGLVINGGSLSGVAGITTTGGYTQSGNGANTFTGATALSNTTNSANAFQVNNAAGNNIINFDTTGATQNNLITNPSFEAGSTTGWTGANGCTLTSVTTATSSPSGTTPYNGNYMAQCANTATAGAEFKYVTGALTANTIYRLDFYAKDSALSATDTGTVLNFGHVENGGAEDASGLSLTSQFIGNNGWTRYSLSFKTGATLAAGDYIYIKQNDAVARSLWLDSVILQTDANAPTSTTYREGKVQLSGPITSALSLQNSTNSSSAFEVQNALGASILDVDTTDTNLITNGGGEASTVGWSGKGAGTIVRDTSQSNFGTASFKITGSAANDGAAYTFTSPLPIGTYSIGISVKVTGNAFPANTLVYGLTNSGGDNNCTSISPAVTATVPSSGGWTRFTSLSCTITTTAATAFYVKQTDATAHNGANYYSLDGTEIDPGVGISAHGGGALSINAVIKTSLQLQNSADSTTALSLYNAAGSDLLLNADTLNSTIAILSANAISPALTVTNNTTTTGNVATISSTAILTGTGNLETLTANSATTPTGLLTVNGTGLTSGYASNINVNSATTLTTGGALNIVGPTGAANLTGGTGLLKVQSAGAFTSSAGVGGLLQVSSATATGTVASIIGTGVLTNTGNLLTVTDNVATTPTGLLTVNGTGLTSGYASNINVNSATTLTTGGALNIVGPTGAANLTGGTGLLKVQSAGAFTSSAGVGGLLQVSSSGTTTGTLASIVGSGALTTTGNLLTLTANTATTATGLLQINGTALTTGSALTINSGSGTALTVDSGSALDLASATAGNTAVLKISQLATAGTCASGSAQGLIIKNTGGTQVGHICINGPSAASNPNGLMYYANAFNATSTDVAENYSDVNNDLVAGDLVALSPSGPADAIVKATAGAQSQLFGIISTSPGVDLTGISEDEEATALVNPKPVALTGRVPTNVSTENGPIAIGDYLTISSTPGVAMKATSAGPVIGRALEAYNGSGIAQIEVFAQISYYAGPTTTQTLQNESVNNLTADGLVSTTEIQVSDTATIANLLATKATIQNLTVTGAASLQSLTVASSITAQSLVVSGLAQLTNLQVAGQINLGSVNEDPTAGTAHPITAEFKASTPISAGEVVVLDPIAGQGWVTTTNQNGDTDVVGVAVTSATTNGTVIQVAIGGTANVSIDGLSRIGQLVETDVQAGKVTIAANPSPGQVIGKVLGTNTQANQVLILVTSE